uniref:Uncharacterized protein n=1 Tax=Romanomermis culicivorax TaxID=13658 RepID=A0A915JI87_ROMCU
MAVCHALNFDQIMLPLTTNITQSSALPAISLRPSNPLLYVFSNSALDGTAPAQVLLISSVSTPANSYVPSSLSQNSTTVAATCASASAVSQIPLPSTAAHASNYTIVASTNSSDSFINIDPPQAPEATRASISDQHSSLAITNTNKVHNFRIEARDALEQLSAAAAQITNNVPTVQTIDQNIGAISDQFQAQQLCIQ